MHINTSYQGIALVEFRGRTPGNYSEQQIWEAPKKNYRYLIFNVKSSNNHFAFSGGRARSGPV